VRTRPECGPTLRPWRWHPTQVGLAEHVATISLGTDLGNPNTQRGVILSDSPGMVLLMSGERCRERATERRVVIVFARTVLVAGSVGPTDRSVAVDLLNQLDDGERLCGIDRGRRPVRQGGRQGCVEVAVSAWLGRNG
jgi:hypothetical protein